MVKHGRDKRVIICKVSKIEWNCVIDHYKQKGILPKFRRDTAQPYIWGLSIPLHMPVLVLLCLDLNYSLLSQETAVWIRNLYFDPEQICFLEHWGGAFWLFKIWKDLYIVYCKGDFPQSMIYALIRNYTTDIEYTLISEINAMP